MLEQTSIRLLICSANLGNAQPDSDSLNAWIPFDGKSAQLVADKKGSVVMTARTFDAQQRHQKQNHVNKKGGESNSQKPSGANGGDGDNALGWSPVEEDQKNKTSHDKEKKPKRSKQRRRSVAEVGSSSSSNTAHRAHQASRRASAAADLTSSERIEEYKVPLKQVSSDDEDDDDDKKHSTKTPKKKKKIPGELKAAMLRSHRRKSKKPPRSSLSDSQRSSTSTSSAGSSMMGGGTDTEAEDEAYEAFLKKMGKGSDDDDDEDASPKPQQRRDQMKRSGSSRRRLKSGSRSSTSKKDQEENSGAPGEEIRRHSSSSRKQHRRRGSRRSSSSSWSDSHRSTGIDSSSGNEELDQDDHSNHDLKVSSTSSSHHKDSNNNNNTKKKSKSKSHRRQASSGSDGILATKSPKATVEDDDDDDDFFGSDDDDGFGAAPTTMIEVDTAAAAAAFPAWEPTESVVFKTDDDVWDNIQHHETTTTTQPAPKVVAAAATPALLAPPGNKRANRPDRKTSTNSADNPSTTSNTASETATTGKPAFAFSIKSNSFDTNNAKEGNAGNKTESVDPFDTKSRSFDENKGQETKMASPPPASSTFLSPKPPAGNTTPTVISPDEKFDIVVIGLQEATFETDYCDKDKEDDDDDEEEDGDDDDESASSQSQADAEGENKMENDTIGTMSSDDELYGDYPMKQKQGLTGKVIGATLKAGKKVGKVAGKSTMKAAKGTMKMSKKTMKHTKTVKTLTKAKDHTNKSTPIPQQFGTTVEDGGLSKWNDTVTLHYLFEDQLPSYKRILSYQLGEMRLLIYAKKRGYEANSILRLDVLSVKTQATGTAGLANKGGIVAEISLNESTRLSFMTAHLEAHEGEEKYAIRCSSCRDILHSSYSSVTPFKYDPVVASHFSFVMGDLNFRTKIPEKEPGSEEHIELSHGMVAEKNWKRLNQFDELASALRARHCLTGFHTPFCNFEPTFKVSRQKGLDYNPLRSPSYTDRILFKAGDQLGRCVRPLVYEPIGNFATSDHKPMRGVFDIRLNERHDFKPVLTGRQELPGMKSSMKGQDPRVGPATMHLFVSAIQCHIDKDVFDKIRKNDYELPNPFVSFVSTPSEAVKDVGSKGSRWKKFGFGGSNKKADEGKTKRTYNSKVKFPSTSVVQSTFKPSWANEEVHFTVKTNRQDGSPMDLSGAVLHVSVFDGKGGDAKLIGSFPLNLSTLLRVAETGDAIELTARNSIQSPGIISPNGRGRPTPPGRNHPSKLTTSSPELFVAPFSKPENGKQGPRPTKPRSPDKNGDPPEQRKPRDPSGAGGGRGDKNPRRHRPNNRGGGRPQIHASKGFLGWSNSLHKLPPPAEQGTTHRDNLDAWLTSKRGSLSTLHKGPTAAMRSFMIGNQQGVEDRREMDERLNSNEMKVMTLRVDEPLVDSGMELGRICCYLDAWWMEENDTSVPHA